MDPVSRPDMDRTEKCLSVHVNLLWGRASELFSFHLRPALQALRATPAYCYGSGTCQPTGWRDGTAVMGYASSYSFPTAVFF